jgi:nucleoid DNA-binding protein
MKPASMSTKDWLLSSVAQDLEIDEAICDKVISWSYEQAKEATKTSSSVELSGFGKLLVTAGKLNRRLQSKQSLLDFHLALPEEEKNHKKIATLREEINYLNTKQGHGQSKENFRRLEK